MATINTKTQPLDRHEIEAFVPRGNFRTVKAFENLFQDVSSTIPDAIGQSVQGPGGGSVDDNVVVFNGTTGLSVKDSGVGIDDLATLESPAFTGVPTAPTAPPGTSTGQLATTAFVSDATNDSVSGPASATDDAIALFDGITGKLIQDSGVLVTSLAPIASPAFTGVPTAPTAAPGTSTTQLATTAFVTTADNLKADLASPTFTGDPKAPTPAPGDNDTSIATTAFTTAAIAALSAVASSFSVHNNGTAQSIPHNTPTKLTFSTEDFDVGSDFASSTWTPPSGRLVMLTGTMNIASVDTATTYVAIYKNGAEFKRGPLALASAATNNGGIVTCVDIPNGTDTYELWGFQNTGVAQNTLGGATLTYFQGTSIQA